MRRSLCILGILAAGGCSSDGSQSSGSLSAAAEVAGSTWVALDLTTGVFGPVDGEVDPGAAMWRGSRVLFRQIPAGAAVVGRPVADSVAEADEHPQRQIAHGRLWIAALELTQAQWQAMTGSQPWLAVLPVTDPTPWIGADLPAFGITPRMAETALARWSRDGWLVDLPEPGEWERACLADESGKFAWGDSLAPETAAAWAVCDPGGALPHPQAVGGRTGNAWGLHDMHGNVWELVRDGIAWQARGGAWDQPVVTARASNLLEISDPDTQGWSVGLRPVLRR